jgi:CheY-like chemotaxis protein
VRQEPLVALPAEVLNCLQGLRPLVVDDNATSRRLLAGWLRQLGMNPMTAAGADEALATLATAREEGMPFALALIDGTLAGGGDGFALAGRLASQGIPAGQTVMLLSAPDQQGEVARCRRAGMPVYALKPLKESDLRKAVLRALEVRVDLADDSDSDTLDEQGAAAAGAPQHRLRILLVDDNVFNQKVGVLKLEKDGHTVQVAGSGREALAAVDGGRFDVILMDMQMPDMDGAEVTALIREREREVGGRVPVIALTAHAMKGDRERCLAAGMDGYVTKPVQDRELRQALRDVLPADPIAPSSFSRDPGGSAGSAPPSGSRLNGGGDSAPTTHRQAPATLFDTAVVLARVGGNMKTLRDLAVVFNEDSERLAAEIGAAVRARDVRKLRPAAHTLRGMVGFFAATGAVEATVKLETLEPDGDWSCGEAAFATLGEEIGRIRAVLADLCEETAA